MHFYQKKTPSVIFAEFQMVNN